MYGFSSHGCIVIKMYGFSSHGCIVMIFGCRPFTNNCLLQIVSKLIKKNSPHDIAEILLMLALSTNQSINQLIFCKLRINWIYFQWKSNVIARFMSLWNWNICYGVGIGMFLDLSMFVPLSSLLWEPIEVKTFSP